MLLHEASTRVQSQKKAETFRKRCAVRPGLTLLVDGDQPVHLVGLGDVQLSSLHHLRELRALVEGAAQTRLPGRRVVLTPFCQLPFKLRPRLQEDRRPRWILGYLDVLSLGRVHELV